MCRLYTLRSNQRRMIGCELIAAQNSLLRQSLGDADGDVHADGWGLGHYQGGAPQVIRQPAAASFGDGYRWAAAKVFTTNAVAHVRNATVGRAGLANTHPFRWGNWLFAHNGTLAAFGTIRPQLVAAMTPELRAIPKGDTDSEHVFHFLMSRHQRAPTEPLVDTLRRAVADLVTWSEVADRGAEVALNLVLTDGTQTVIQRLGRSLWQVERLAVHPCQVCNGSLHIEGPPRLDYRAVAFASEPVTTDERWTEVGDGTVFSIDTDTHLHTHSV